MSEKSILDQIISNHKAEEVANLDAVEIIGNMFSELNERERDVLSRRFGLHGQGKETLENIGNVHSLTRERIRQIENTSVKKLRQLKSLDNYISNLKNVINQLIDEHGGMIERDYLLNNLVNFSSGNIKNEEKVEQHKNHLDFLILKLLENEFESVGNSKYFKNYYKYKHQETGHLEKMAEELGNKIKEAKKILRTEELIELAKELDSYKNNADKLNVNNNVDISNVLRNDFFDENAELINANKAIYTILQAAKYIEQNKFGHWGLYDWREIKPKTINDKIYLVLLNHSKPMHFAKIADRINQIGFDSKKANAATVHNELILDGKYVLVGRGLYSLKEWGYKEGTVADIIIGILSKSDEPLSRNEIIEKVLEQRLVKKATIILALMNKNKFEKVDSGKYKLRSKK
jgi:hypothetical protein